MVNAALRFRILIRILTIFWVLLGAVPGVAEESAELEVRIEGLDGELEDNVRSLLSIAEAASEEGTPDPRRIANLHDAARGEIARALQPFGHYRPEVDAELERRDSGWLARYRVDPGPPVPVASVELRVAGEGRDQPEIRQAVSDFPLAEGEPLSHPAYEEGKIAILEAASGAGYLDAHYTSHTVRVDLESYRATVRLHLETGPRYRFGEVSFEQEVLKPSFLAGYVPFEPGDPFEIDALLRLQAELSDGPYFRRVEVESLQEEADGQRVPVVVHLEPSKRRKFTFGAGYGTDTGARAQVGLELRRINRRGHRGELELEVSQLEQHLSASYLVPGAYPRTDLLALRAAYSDEDPETSRSRTAYLGAHYSHSRGGWREAVSLGYQRERYEVGVDSGTSDLLIPGASWSRVVADDRIDPRRGYRVRFELRGGAEALLSDASFLQAVAAGKVVHGLGERNRVLARLEVGYLATSDFRTLPPSVRFFAGGDQSVRGFDYRSIGRLDAEGNVIGGERLLTASLEYERRFLAHWGAAVFADAGSAGRTFGASPSVGVGAGARWHSPIGPIRADVAFAVSEEGNPVRLHLSVGPEL